MAVSDRVKKAGRGLAVAAAMLGGAALIAPQPAHAVSPGWAAAIGVGSFALGAAAAHGAYGYPYGGYYYAPPAPAYYYPPAPAYYPRSCWDPYYRRYYAC